MSDDSKELSRVEDILSGEDYLPKKPMSRVEELLMDGAMVPKVDDTDNGKVLKVIDGEWQPGEDVSGDNLPPVSSLDNGKVLKVVNGEWNIGDDKSESSFVYISSSYPFSGSKVALPANINNVLIANYTSSPKVPTFIVTSNNIIFEPKEVSISTGTTPSVHIRWGRMYSTFDSATREQDIYNDSLSYNTQNQTTEASYFKTKAIQTIPPVDVPDNGKVMQVAGGHWVANILPEVYGVPVVEQADVGKVLKATDVGEYDWGDAPRTNSVQVPPVIYDDGNLKKMSVDNFPGLEKVYLTAQEYSALTTSQKQDLSKIYYISQYKYFQNNDGTLTVRVDGNNEDVWIFFNGWVFDDSLETNLPEGSAQYCTSIGNSYGYSDAASTTRPSTAQPCWVRFNGTRVSAEFASDYQVNNDIFWPDVAGKYTSPVYGKLKIGEKAGTYNYSNPFDTGETIIIYYGNKQYTDFDIPDPLPAVTSVDNGKVLKVVEGAWTAGADEGGSEAVYKTLTEYEALSTADKEDPTKIYFVIDEGTKVSPTLNADDGNVAASSSKSGYYAWKVFSGSSRTDVQDWEYAWQSWGQNNGEWISYTFSTTQLFSKVSVRIATGKAHTMNYYVEGSNDGTNWINLIPNGVDHISVSQPAQVDQSSLNYVTTEILLDTTKGRFSKIRFRTDSSIGYPYSYDSFTVANFDIYAAVASNKPAIYYKNVLYTPDELPIVSTSDTGKALVVNSEGEWDKGNIPTGLEVVKLSQTAYDSLSDAQKKNGKMYLIDASIFTGGIPRVSSYNSKITASSNNGSENQYNAWLAFDGIDHVSGLDYDGWVPNNGNNQWIKYHFDLATPINKIMFKAISRNTTPWTGTIYIEGSNDDTNWENILKDRISIDTTLPNRDNSSVIFNEIANGKSYTYVRLRISNQYTTSFELCEFDADITTLTYDSIYYINRQYSTMYEPVPVVTMADAGKALIVNSEGEWDKGNIPRTNSVQVPPVIFDNNKLMKIADMTGFPELEKVFVTSEEYAQLTTAQKQDLSKIYYVSPYKFYTLKDGEITIRVNSTTYEWFFNGFVLTESFYIIPSEYRQYTKNDPYEGSTAWSDNTSSTSLGIIEMGPSGYTERISAQDGNWGGNVILNTPIYGKVVIGNGDSQRNTYSDPYDVETPILIYYGGKQYTDYTMPSVYRELTQAEYDTLPSSKNSDGIIYFITDNS